MVANIDDHPFLTARHVDNLTESVKALNRVIVDLAVAQREALKATRELAALLRALQPTTSDTQPTVQPANAAPAAPAGGRAISFERRKKPR